MKYGFLIIFLALAAVSVGYGLMTSEQSEGKPVIYWVTDSNPARVEQVKLFEQWLKSHHYPDVDLRLDSANSDPTKKLIQGVSGVGSDIMDMSPSDLPLFHAVGILQDLTLSARKLGFDPIHSYAAVKPLIMVDDRQYAFPCNVSVAAYWINKATFERYGIPIPPRRWSLEEFERIGRRFVDAANSPGKPRTIFFASQVSVPIIRRSLGLDDFNETLTRCTLDDPRAAQTLDLIRKWMYVDRILPTNADVASFATQAGYGGAALQLFNSGNYGMFQMGRYALIQLRQFGNLQLSVSEPPNGGFRNTILVTRAAGVYAGSKHQDLADLFLAFLASKEYNMQIVRDSDALPPDPKYTHTEEFRHPPKHPNEWGCHEVFADLAQTIAIAPAVSPFVLPSVVARWESQAYDAAVTSGRLSTTLACRQAARNINLEIQRSLKEDPSMNAPYERALQLQKKIEQYRLQGRKVPLGWIKNPFHRAYYLSKGWAE
jgi:multiple sugar transport system substrate-binding protein